MHTIAGVRARRLDEARSHITTTIHYFDRPGDVYEYGVDSLPLFLAALRAADATTWSSATALAGGRDRPLLREVVDPSTGLVRSDRKYSAHRDTVVNRSNAYGNTMVALLAKTIEETGWFASPFERHFEGDYGRLLLEHFWVDDHFRDGLGDDTVSGEANIWPFYTGVIADPAIIAAGARATSTRMGSATRIRCGTRRAAGPSARSG